MVPQMNTDTPIIKSGIVEDSTKKVPHLIQPSIETARLLLEPITEHHAEELCEFFQDRELHTFVPFEAPTLEEQRARCARWEKRRSPDGTETWLNWAARDRATGKLAAHLQVGIQGEGIATIGYVVARSFQRLGLATEAMEAIFVLLRDRFSVREVKAWSDSRNHASHQLAQKLGMVQVEFIKDADFFKGTTSDEFVFSRKLAP